MDSKVGLRPDELYHLAHARLTMFNSQWCSYFTPAGHFFADNELNIMEELAKADGTKFFHVKDNDSNGNTKIVGIVFYLDEKQHDQIKAKAEAKYQELKHD